jgi:hypothetical protein
MSIHTEHSLRTLLRRHDVPDHTWRHYPDAKTVADLLKEINRGESTITVEMGRLIRTVHTVGPNIYYAHPDGRWQNLVEARRVHADGHIERRTVDTSLGEKITSGESTEHAVTRAIKEELGIDFSFTEENHTIKPMRTSEGPSASYPGLTSRYCIVWVKIIFDASHYRPEGYTEVKNGRTTYFEWVGCRL